jgi:short-subunit dehydrogenase
MSDTSRPLAVVTGGSNGIGLELARQFADNGYDLLIAAENEAHLREAAAQLGTNSASVDVYAGDLGTEQAV